MNEFRRLAAKIDQHMQQLAAQGVSETYAFINRMMGYGPDLHRIWVGRSDRDSLHTQGAEPKVQEYVNEVFGRLAERIKQLAGLIAGIFGDSGFVAPCIGVLSNSDLSRRFVHRTSDRGRSEVLCTHGGQPSELVQSPSENDRMPV